MNYCLWDVLYAFSFHHCPILLQDEELFERFHGFIVKLLEEERRKEKQRMRERIERGFNVPN